MKETDIKNLVNRENEKKLRLALAQTVASNIMHQLQIPDGNHMVFALDQSCQVTNRDAIASWVLPMIDSRGVSSEQYESLRVKLRSLLEDSQREEFL